VIIFDFRQVAASAVVLPIKAYRLVVSPLLGTNCRFAPSCSEYAVEAIQRHGVTRGSWLTLRRIARCHPFGAHGHDPVPPAERRAATPSS
jgi:putative membrane protein insertion efficiency factor